MRFVFGCWTHLFFILNRSAYDSGANQNDFITFGAMFNVAVSLKPISMSNYKTDFCCRLTHSTNNWCVKKSGGKKQIYMYIKFVIDGKIYKVCTICIDSTIFWNWKMQCRFKYVEMSELMVWISYLLLLAHFTYERNIVNLIFFFKKNPAISQPIET